MSHPTTSAPAASLSQRRAVRRLVVAAAGLGVAGAAVLATSEAALANQGGTLSPGQSASFSTWFFGKTVICFADLGGRGVNYHWDSGPTHVDGSVPAGQKRCESRSYVGYNITIKNTTGTGGDRLGVTFPYGP